MDDDTPMPFDNGIVLPDAPKKLLLTVGLPRSGKSTAARSWGYPIVNPDSIRVALHGQPFVGEAEPFVWAIAKCMVRALFLAGHTRVVLDATNTTRQRRADWKSRSWNRLFIQFGDRHMRDECITRARAMDATPERIAGLVAAIERMAEQWEDVADDELDEYTG